MENSYDYNHSKLLKVMRDILNDKMELIINEELICTDINKMNIKDDVEIFEEDN